MMSLKANYLTLVMLNKDATSTSPANQITWSGFFFIEIHIFNDKQCRSRSVGFLTDLDLHCLLRRRVKIIVVQILNLFMQKIMNYDLFILYQIRDIFRL